VTTHTQGILQGYRIRVEQSPVELKPVGAGETTINILLVDDHGIFREGVALLLKSLDSAIEVTHARTARECLDKAATGQFGLVLLDLGLPDKPGIDALSDLKHAHPDLPIVVLSGHEERETVLESIRRGAMGFIPKSSDDPKLLWHALKMAVSGAVTVPPSMAVTPAAQRPDPDQTPPTRVEDLGLTPRQLEVLRLLVQGLPNKSIARRLDIAETTARGYVSDLLAAFRVTNRTQLVLDVAKRGLVLNSPTMPLP
jgi:DNA-binding NarL/FixJ family response regulator